MRFFNRSLPISEEYDGPIWQALRLQVIIGLFSLLLLDFGQIAQFCGISLLAFWTGALVLIWRHPQSPSKVDLELIRFGYLVVVVIALGLVSWIWRLQGK